MTAFQVGDRVRWRSQSSGIETTKEGEVVEAVPAGQRPEGATKAIARSGVRLHESYLVRACVVRKGTRALKDRRKYWPRVSALELVEQLEPGTVEMVLGLVMETPPSRDVVASWTPEQRFEAVEWGGAVHLSASDNNNRVPPRPRWLQKDVPRMTVPGADIFGRLPGERPDRQ